MVFRDHARVGLLWLVVTVPSSLSLLCLPPLSLPARPSVLFVASAPCPRFAPVAVALYSLSSSRARPQCPRSAEAAFVPRNCTPHSVTRSLAGARPEPRCAPHSARAVLSHRRPALPRMRPVEPARASCAPRSSHALVTVGSVPYRARRAPSERLRSGIRLENLQIVT